MYQLSFILSFCDSSYQITNRNILIRVLPSVTPSNQQEIKTTIISVCNEGETIRDSAKIADSMNAFFCNIDENLSKDTPRYNPFLDGTYETPKQDALFHFSPISCEKLGATMENIKSLV